MSARVILTQQQDYQFSITFAPQWPPLHVDEPPPLGAGSGPTPVDLLLAAAGNCLSASLLFSYRKFKQAPEPIQTEVTAEVGRNAEGRVRILGIAARLQLGVPGQQLEHTARVMEQFTNFCTVTASIGQGIPIKVMVVDSAGETLRESSLI